MWGPACLFPHEEVRRLPLRNVVGALAKPRTGLEGATPRSGVTGPPGEECTAPLPAISRARSRRDPSCHGRASLGNVPHCTPHSRSCGGVVSGHPQPCVHSHLARPLSTRFALRPWLPGPFARGPHGAAELRVGRDAGPRDGRRCRRPWGAGASFVRARTAVRRLKDFVVPFPPPGPALPGSLHVPARLTSQDADKTHRPCPRRQGPRPSLPRTPKLSGTPLSR